MGRLIVTTTSAVSPGLMVAELATALTPQAQVVGSSGSARMSPICRGASPVFVSAKRYSIGVLWLMGAGLLGMSLLHDYRFEEPLQERLPK